MLIYLADRSLMFSQLGVVYIASAWLALLVSRPSLHQLKASLQDEGQAFRDPGQFLPAVAVMMLLYPYIAFVFGLGLLHSFLGLYGSGL